MSEAIFPTLPGQTWPRTKTIRTSTLERRANGRRFALSLQAYPTYLYSIPYSFLRSADLDTLAGFFRARRGKLDDFRFDDRDDNTATEQVFAIADGTTATYQLARTLAGVTEPITAVNGAPVVKVNGAVTAVTTDSFARVTFGSPPATGATLSWTGLFHWRVTFTKDEQAFDEFMRRLYSTKSVEFETYRP